MSRNINMLPVSVTASLVVMICLLVAGCTPTQEGDTLSALQSALATLQSNRALCEQFVRDVKTSVNPSDPAYQQAMESYEEARDSYNHFLDTVEAGAGKGKATTRQMKLGMNTQDSTAEFFQDATRALRPSMNTRGIDFQRAVVIPDDLAKNFHKLPKGTRSRLIDQVDGDVRWRSWGQL